ncbi:hypothetical protein [Corynebacterium sp. ACRQJ]|uniref:hypothetical protein n=1 Tax=Corynebacterium sp. ACRQJ TaxID=2918189 RepID=UPI001EF64B1C|nr:hypothetical protein [Corynebacterium sp. ACRQJ]MCG7268260.1 hypothetical protein [Corynebacterium sp. ACRQJ]
MRRPYLIAESPQVTVLRSLASTAFGKVSITLPEGAEMDGIFTPSAPGNELGYVAALNSEKRVGGMFRRFVRADVDITAKGAPAPASDVEQVLDEAAKRTSGEFFLESDITLAGLGDWVPLQDFHVGDLVDVEIWGMVVPMRVTRIEPIVSDHSVVDWRVHVGGQLVSDEDALLAANATIHRVLVEDRRDLAGLSERVVAAQSAADAAGESARVADGKAVAADSKAKAAGDAAKEADDKAVAAQATADDADGKAKKLAEALSGGGATIPTVMADLQRLNKQLQENDEGGAADQGLIPAYIAANTKRWELQEKVDKQQDELAEANRLATEANAAAIKAQEDLALAKVREDRVRPKLAIATRGAWMKGAYITPDKRFKIETDDLQRGVTITALGDWEGAVVVFYGNGKALGADGGTEMKFQLVAATEGRSWSYLPSALVGVDRVTLMTMPNEYILGS